MLYLRKFNNFKIILRGKPVEQYTIADGLRNAQDLEKTGESVRTVRTIMDRQIKTIYGLDGAVAFS
ncbi:putative morc, S5 domain 2 protein [Helianthus annuus]|nr:putative morc, S5 domain 2 protein [Helianthus annuus]